MFGKVQIVALQIDFQIAHLALHLGQLFRQFANLPFSFQLRITLLLLRRRDSKGKCRAKRTSTKKEKKHEAFKGETEHDWRERKRFSAEVQENLDVAAQGFQTTCTAS